MYFKHVLFDVHQGLTHVFLAWLTCRSYKEWREEKEHGTLPSNQPQQSSAGAATSNSSAGSAPRDAVKELGKEGKDTAGAVGEVVHMEGRAAGKRAVHKQLCA